VSVNKKKEKISRVILNYLQKNPDAGDTLEAISKWWLEIERTDISVDEVAEVLDRWYEGGISRRTVPQHCYRILTVEGEVAILRYNHVFQRWFLMPCS